MIDIYSNRELNLIILQVGVIIGRLGVASRDYLVLLIPTPPLEVSCCSCIIAISYSQQVKLKRVIDCRQAVRLSQSSTNPRASARSQEQKASLQQVAPLRRYRYPMIGWWSMHTR